MSALVIAAAAALAPADGLKARIDPLAADYLKGRKNAGVVVGVYRGGRPRVFGYGTVFLRTGEAAPRGDTVFAIGSITKPVTGVLLAEAVRRGEVTLDAPANEHLPPDLRLRHHVAGPITLEHLATHSSGLPVEPPLLGLIARDPANPYGAFDRRALAAMLKTLTPGRPPGGKYEYSNLGAGLLGHALVHAAGAASYDALVKERVCRPLGLTDTAEALTGGQLARLARGHDEDGAAGPHWDFATLGGCGCLKSTANDLLALAAAVVGDRHTPLAPALETSATPRRPADGGYRVGLFWMLDVPTDGPTLVWHNGGTYVARAMFMAVPARKVAVVVLGSRADEEVDRLAGRVLTAVEGKLQAAKDHGEPPPKDGTP